MLLVVMGVVLMALKWLGYPPVAHWDWWWVLSPFAVAFVWFEFFEEISGSRKRHAMAKEKQRQKETLEVHKRLVMRGTGPKEVQAKRRVAASSPRKRA